MSLFDTHAHLEALEDLAGSLERASNEGVSTIITIGTDLKSSRQAIEIAEKYSKDDFEIWATCGIHPGDGKNDVEKLGLEECVKQLKKIVTNSKRVVGVGEAGLDYYLVDSDLGPATDNKEKEYQRELFGEQIKLAKELSLPIIVHCRNGWSEIFDLISNSQTPNSKISGVFHSFTGGVIEAKKATERNFFVSFSGIVTFKNAQEIQEASKIVPNDKILIETDSPFLSPEPFRGRKNEPSRVRIVGTLLSNLLKIEEDVFFRQTSQNARHLFNI